ncbi:hypothetical protein NQ487_10375 [Hungatella hathewayi]|uniref:Uncharacterized protein n=1 Tax=Hungatella hathewayi DSM 13479 TaxID=566550 RepID=D3AG25_9FIRM|nr:MULTISPECIES: hypothetical protein [Hungatella]EFC99231.1 hypothetical protein CLOSTHATH_02561 [Hungatella hathewayi DSM 13479]MDU4976563.1 hypothetical protein [Hungatella hathewayi]UWO87289.1 hypothetical protein NQ487_10375 [Hungatella hathewayi]
MIEPSGLAEERKGSGNGRIGKHGKIPGIQEEGQERGNTWLRQ